VLSIAGAVGREVGESGEKVYEVGGGVELRIGEGFRVTYSWIASSAHVSRDLKEYLFEIRAMSMSWVKSALGELTIRRSGGLRMHSRDEGC
jgi:hypothetical protein